MAKKPRKQNEVLGIRLLRRGRKVREFDLDGNFTVGGLRTNSTVLHDDDPNASDVHFKEGPEGKAILLFDEDTSGKVATKDGETSLTILRSSGVLKRENKRWAFTIEKGVTGTIETDGLTFEFGYRPASVTKPIIIPKAGPAFEEQVTVFGGDEDTIRFRKTLAVSCMIGIGFFIWTQVANPVEREFKIEDIVSRITKLDVPEVTIEGIGEAETDVGTGTGTGGGGGGGGGYGGGGDGTAMPSTGVIAAITTIGPGGGRSLADILGGGGGTGDLDTIATGIGGLKGAGTGSGLGGGLGLGGEGGTGLGGSGEGIAGLAGGGGGIGDGSGTRLVKKNISVSASAPSSISGAGAGSGGRSAADISGVIRRHLAGIQNAYVSELKKNPNLGGGKIVVRFAISSDGGVTSASIVSSTMGAPSLESRVVSLIYGWRFPAGASGEVTVIYPFVFIATE
jgi:TonB family protein